MTYERGKSDSAVVPTKQPNKATQVAAEVVKGRALAKGNSLQRNTPRTQCRAGVPRALERVRQAAKADRKQRFTALLHHVYSVDCLRTAYRSLKRTAAAGIDEETWQHYGEDLEANLADLAGRVKSGAYRAKPVRRAYIAKTDGRMRPLGVPTLEDKIVQRAVVEVLNAIYETDFLGFSYGFRPRRSQHHALDALTVGIQEKKVNWVLDADIRAFFDSLKHEWLVKFVEHRIADRRIVRLIQKWLSAGVWEDGKHSRSEEGTVQGGSISPLLANIYLHYAFDLWVHQWRSRDADGDVIVVRYADDFVMGFQHRHDAEQFLASLRERFAKFGLELHPDKTRLIEFGRFAAENRRKRGKSKPETFDFLGFTHACSKTRENRKFAVRRLTMRKRLRAKLQEVKEELRRRMHQPVHEHVAYLGSVLRGHYGYYGVPNNLPKLRTFDRRVAWLWKRTLQRRSQTSRLTQRKWLTLRRRLPEPHVCHPWPNQRLDGRTRGRSRMR